MAVRRHKSHGKWVLQARVAYLHAACDALWKQVRKCQEET